MQAGVENDNSGEPASAAEPGRPRVSGIDMFRAALLALVVLGHFAELTERQHFLTWLGVGFRMPLFIGLSGYLFNLDDARSLTTRALFGKYYPRLILPWIAACAVALTITGSIEWRSPIYAIVRPPYHLWFVPVMMAFILAAGLSRLSRTHMLAAALPVSIAAMYVFGVGHDVWQMAAWVPDRRYFIYPVYFALGMWVAERRTDDRATLLLAVAAAAGLLWWTWLYRHPSTTGETAAELLLCVPLIVLLPRLRRVRFDIPLLSAVGRDSLFFYLWHPLAFACWSAIGAWGLALLALSTGSMLVGWRVIGRTRRLAQVLGVRPARLPAPPISPTLPDTVSVGGTI